MVRLSLRLRETYSLYSLPVSRRTLCHFELRRTMRTTGVRAGKSLQAGGKVWRFTDNGLGTDSSNPSSFGRESSNIQFLRRRLRPTALSIGARAPSKTGSKGMRAGSTLSPSGRSTAVRS